PPDGGGDPLRRDDAQGRNRDRRRRRGDAGRGRTPAAAVARAVTVSDFDPFDPAQSRDAWDLLRALRRDTPVATVHGGMRYVTRHDAARATFRDTESFSNALGMKAP